MTLLNLPHIALNGMVESLKSFPSWVNTTIDLKIVTTANTNKETKNKRELKLILSKQWKHNCKYIFFSSLFKYSFIWLMPLLHSVSDINLKNRLSNYQITYVFCSYNFWFFERVFGPKKEKEKVNEAWRKWQNEKCQELKLFESPLARDCGNMD